MPPTLASIARSTAACMSDAFTAACFRRCVSEALKSRSSLTSARDNASRTSRASCVLVANCASRMYRSTAEEPQRPQT
eukprot:16448518-Heterocapsa_arctica.AAC.2